MPISATGPWIDSVDSTRRENARPGAARGFTLLELLVVVAIIGIFAGVAVLSIGVTGTDRTLQREAFRLRSILDLVREEALMQNRNYGVVFTDSAYRFLVFDPRQSAWLRPVDDPLLQPHEFDEQIDFSLTVEDRELVLDRNTAENGAGNGAGNTVEEDADNDDEEPQPQVMILADGQITPFEATLYRDFDGPRFVLRAKLDGTLEVAGDERSVQ